MRSYNDEFLDLIDEESEEIKEDNTQNDNTQDDIKAIFDDINQVKEDVSYLRDLFVRRLNEDKQKNSLIQKIEEGATYTFIEPFLHDIILLLDRLEKANDDFSVSVKEELYEIVNRRGVERIRVTQEFNPALYKAVKTRESAEADRMHVAGIIRHGYTLGDKVIRPAEVLIVKPIASSIEGHEQTEE